MNQKKDTILVFTARSFERIVAEGGSQAWVLNRERAAKCKWLVCTQNQNNADEAYFDPTEAHGSGFFLGKISGIRASSELAPNEKEGKGRWIITISKFTRINRPGLWGGFRNPVHYTSLETLGIKIDELELQTLPSIAN